MIFKKIKRFLYFRPSNKKYGDIPDEMDDIYITNDKNYKLNGWYYRSKNNKNSDVYLYCHGNAGNMSMEIPFFNVLIKHDISILAFDYSGYGNSEGTSINEDSIYNDAEIWMKYLIEEKQYSKDNIVPLGFSIGSCPAIRLANTYKTPKLVIFSGFYKLYYLVKDKLWKPLTFLIPNEIKNDFDNSEYIKNYEGHIFMIHSKTDGLISYKHAEMNINNCKYGNGISLECGGTHNNPSFTWKTFKKIIDFEIMDI